MEGWVPIFFLMVVLKIPVAMLLYIAWWAFHAQPEPEEAASDEGGEHAFKRYRRDPSRPRGPRRGPHAPDALPLPDCPPGGRTRVLSPPAPARAAAHYAQRGTAEPLERR